MTAQVVVLIGPPGVGKTSVGQELAQLVGVTHCDTDAIVAHRAGMPVSDIFIDQGEAAFRKLERAAVVEALATFPAVVSLGGGAVLNEETAADVAQCFTVYLSGSLRHVSRRAGFDQGRPLLALNPRGQWLTLLEQRKPIYERVSAMELDTDGLTVAEVAHQLLDAVREAGVFDGR